MVREVDVQIMIEQVRQLIECHMACIIPGCADRSLGHFLFDIVPESAWPVISSYAACATSARLEDMRMEGSVQAVCDLAIQSGRMQVLNAGEALMARWHVQSIAAFSLERPAGILGTLLLADERAGKFGEGEERLLYAFLSMYGAHLEAALQALTRKYAQAPGVNRGGEGLYAEPDRFIRSEFVSMVGHELRAPLSVIKGYAGLLQVYGGANGEPDPALTPVGQRHYLDVIIEQVEFLELLVGDLLDISRIQRGQLALRPRIVDVGALCRQVVQLEQFRANQREPGKHRLECRFSTPLPSFRVDAERLQQVLMNILENAVKYSPEGGSIELEAGLVGERGQQRPSNNQSSVGQVRISVRDHGVGIPAWYSTRLFQPFERLGQSTTLRIPGTGLGLYIARKLIEAMGGKIEVQSCEEKGTDVTIILPTIAAGEVSASETPVQVPSLSVG